MNIKNLPAIVVKFPLEATEKVHVLGFRILSKFGQQDSVALINRAVLISPKYDIGLDTGSPLINVTFNLLTLKK